MVRGHINIGPPPIIPPHRRSPGRGSRRQMTLEIKAVMSVESEDEAWERLSQVHSAGFVCKEVKLDGRKLEVTY